MVYVFGEWTLDTQRSELRRAGQVRQLRRKVFQVLTYLLVHPDRVVSKSELCEQVWAQQCISDAALESTLKAVRQAIGDSGRTQQLIQTVYGQGYRFRAAVEKRPDIRSGTAAEDAMAPLRTPSTPPQTVHNVALSPPAPGVSGAQDGNPGSDAGTQDGPLQSSAPASAGEWKLVTVLCGAVAEVSAAAPPEPERHYRQVRALSTLARDAVQQYGGTLQPVVGECIIAVFGAPIAQEEHAQRAVLAALDLQHRVREASGDALAVRLGVHTGVVAVHGLENAPMTLGAVVGDTVTGAMALQAHAAPGTVRCSGATARLVRGFVRLVAQEPVAAGERSMPMSVYQVARLRGGQPPRLRPQARPLRPFVGRARELTTLQELFAQVEAGQGQVVGIVGEPGIGKSRLLSEFRRLRGRRLTYLAGGCRSYGQPTPYLPVRTLLRMHCGIAATDSPAIMVVKVRRRLTEVGMAPEEWAPYLLWLLEVSTDTDPLATVSPQEMRARTTEALVQLALHGALQLPLVLEVENLHWIDPSSEEVLTVLAERLACAAILLLTTARPGYHPPWIDRSYTSQVALARLTPAESRLVVQSVTQATPLPEPLIRTIVVTAVGNPFFLEELARTVVEQDAQATPLRIPNTVQAVLAARIDRLPSEAKRLLQTAAVIGREVPFALLHTVTALPIDALYMHLRHLQAAEFLYETPLAPAPVYTFKHALTQEVAYQSLLQSTRQDYHQQIAQALEERFPQTIETQPELLAHHYSQSGNIPKAVDYLHRAGHQAVERSAYAEAVSHLTTAFDLLTSLPETHERSQRELAVQMTLGMAFKATKGWGAPEVERLYTRARALCEQVGEPPQLFRVLWGLWSTYNARGQSQTMRALGEQLLSLAQRLHDSDLLLEAHHALWTSLFSSGELAAARAHQAQGLRLYDPQRHRTHAALYSGHDPGVCCHYRAAPSLWLLGYPTQAVASSQAALALAQ